jgi:pSer/pThr/pTyr-binding forkhead associated (FHA) protein
MALDPLLVLVVTLGLLGVLVAGFVVASRIRRRKAQPAAEPAQPREPVAVALLERLGEDDGPRIYALHRPLMGIGRGADNDLRIAPDVPGALTVSRRHAQIRREDMDYIVEDVGSTNGIRVNGLATHRNLLRDGDHVSFGSVEFVFQTSESPTVSRMPQ